jgi:hypothetical protein
MSPTIKVLLLAANPARGSSEVLHVDREIRGAVESARTGGALTRLRIKAELAVRRDDLLPALMRHKPRIVHFAAHGSGGRSLVLDDGSHVGGPELVALFGSVTGVRAVVLTACGGLDIARALSEVVDYAVAMELPITDAAAIHFTGVFYAALAFGRTVPAAFDVARTSTNARFGPKGGIPHLLARPGAEARPLVDAAPAPAAIRQRNQVKDVVAGKDVKVGNEASARAETPVDQSNIVNGIQADGSVNIGNTAQ